MSLARGTRLDAYEILDSLGAGGMGEVYRAFDSHLQRDVAIKVLPEAFSHDDERLARFEREARTLASLNHPNIAVVYALAVQPHGGPDHVPTRALVMELVEGPTLADRIALGPIPVEDALPIARQIAEALEAAHEHGIIHRDLKPANVKVRADGTVKVLDFGLAKALEPAVLPSGMSLSPTITSPAMTQAGMILGTAAYMSPEQARGKPVDRRADIWAFGCVLFEMLSGQRAVGEGETVSDTVAAILKSEPAWDVVPRDTPPRIRTLLERCLRKDLRRRLPDIAEARIQIEEAATDPPQITRAVVGAPRRNYFWPAVAAVSLLVAAGLAVRPPRTPATVDAVSIRIEIPPPPGSTPVGDDGRPMEAGDLLAPDGRTVTFLATAEGRRTIWIRRLESAIARPLPGTEDARRWAWSPDSKRIAFIAQGQLKTVAVSGGPSTRVASTDGRDVAWGPGDVILIGGRDASQNTVGPWPIRRISLGDGQTTAATTLAPNETTHDYPEFLPDGRHFVYLARQREAIPGDWDVYVGSLGSNDRKRLSGIHAGVQYSPTGHLLYVDDTTLMARPFDVNRLELTGDAFVVAEGVTRGPRPPVSVSGNGSLAYLSLFASGNSQLAWFNRRGVQLAAVGAPAQYDRFRLSPNDRWLAFDRELDVFVLDLERGTTRPFATGQAADIAPIWISGGDAIAFGSSREPIGNVSQTNVNAANLYQRVFAVTGKDELIWQKTINGKIPTDWWNGNLVYTSGGDIWTVRLPASADAKPIRVTDTPFAESGGRISRDGRWIAYESTESGRPEVWVQSFPDGRMRQLVSANGGSAPRWARNSAELFYVAPDLNLISISVAGDREALTLGAPQTVFESRAFQGTIDYEVDNNGRFLLKIPERDAASAPIVVLHNWRPE